MLINLKQFQEKAINQLLNSCSSMLDLSSTQNICVFQSPTGSGKTVMTAAFIERLIKRREDEICFLWVTIGRGDLQIQSHNALKRYFNGNPSVTLIEEEFTGGREEIKRNEVVVVNWEKIRSKVRESGEWSNVLMKESERNNFREVLENTRLKRKIVLIIDESHIGASAERTLELRNEFDAHVIIEVSATPKLIPNAEDFAEGKGDLIRVPASQVIEEGLIKKEILINEGVQDPSFNDTNSQDVILELAFRKRNELQDAYDETDVDLNPLVLIQIPNGSEGDSKLESVINFLAEKEVTEINGRLAIWLNDYPSSENIESISLNTNPIQFLIFKQAIDTGWDCPRAQILVKFRQTKSVIFEIQVLGRILRMAEGKHYSKDILNTAFVYTNISDIRVAREEFNPNIIKHLKMVRRPTYSEIDLPSYYKSRADYGDITGEFTNIFADEACKYFGINTLDSKKNMELIRIKGINTEVTSLTDTVISNSTIEVQLFDKLNGDIDSDKRVELSKSQNDTQTEFDQFLINSMGSFTNISRSIPSIKAALFSFFKRYLGISGRKDAFWLQKLILEPTNKNHFHLLLENSVNSFASKKELEVKHRVEVGEKHTSFEVPHEIFINDFTDEIVDFKKNIMRPTYLSIQRSKVERYFEELIDKAENVEWWFKNGYNKVEYLGIKYEYPKNIVKSFYPDYIVKYKDGSVGVFETKAKSDEENLGGLNEKTKFKAEALAKWKSELINKGRDVRAGIVLVLPNRSCLLNEKELFDLDKTTRGDFSDWVPF